MSSLQIRPTVAIAKPRRLAQRGVKSLPVTGYTHRWSPNALSLADGASVFQLPNVGGSGANPLTASDVTAPPILASDAAGRRYLTNETSRRMTTPEDVVNYAQSTMVVVAKVDTIPAAAALFVGSNTPNVTIGVNNGRFYGGAGTAIYGPNFDTGAHVFLFSSTGGAGSVFSLDGQEYNGNGGSNPLTDFRLFGGDSTNVLRGRIYEAAVYPFATTAKQRALIVAHLRSEYGV